MLDFRDGLDPAQRRALDAASTGQRDAALPALLSATYPLVLLDRRTPQLTPLGRRFRLPDDPEAPAAAPVPYCWLRGDVLPALHPRGLLRALRQAAAGEEISVPEPALRCFVKPDEGRGQWQQMLDTGAGEALLRPRWRLTAATDRVLVMQPPLTQTAQAAEDFRLPPELTEADVKLEPGTGGTLLLGWDSAADIPVRRWLRTAGLSAPYRYRLQMAIGPKQAELPFAQWIRAWVRWKVSIVPAQTLDYLTELMCLRFMENTGMLEAVRKTKDPKAELTHRFALTGPETERLSGLNLLEVQARDLTDQKRRVDEARADGNPTERVLAEAAAALSSLET